jgi:hypothetical protein
MNIAFFAVLQLRATIGYMSSYILPVTCDRSVVFYYYSSVLPHYIEDKIGESGAIYHKPTTTTIYTHFNNQDIECLTNIDHITLLLFIYHLKYSFIPSHILFVFTL